MKVFDFTDGEKGELLADIPLVKATGGWLSHKGDLVPGTKVYKIELNRRFGGGNEWQWASSASHPNWVEGQKRPDGDKAILPEDFGVEAICFCQGEVRTGSKTQWNWFVIGTRDWNIRALKAGILKSTFSHVWEGETDED